MQKAALLLVREMLQGHGRPRGRCDFQTLVLGHAARQHSDLLMRGATCHHISHPTPQGPICLTAGAVDESDITIAARVTVGRHSFDLTGSMN